MSVMGSEVNRLLKKIKDGDLTKREELFKITAGHLLGGTCIMQKMRKTW